jgi:hypothetical protein
MQRDDELQATIVSKYAAFSGLLNERSRRLWAACAGNPHARFERRRVETGR